MLAAALTSLSYLPQLQKAMPRDSTPDLSLKMLLALSAALGLWVVYGIVKRDWVIILAQFDRRNTLARRAWVQNPDLNP